MGEKIDLGHGFSMSYIGWHPDRELNPQYERPGKPYPSIEKVGIIVHCPHQGGMCHFDIPEVREFNLSATRWTVEQWEPLTLSPSILCTECGCHGYIREGRWIPA